MSRKSYSRSVFINCPFDEDFRPIFNAIIFTVFNCGYVARCALEIEDAGETRISKIFNIITECKYGIHDISRTELDLEHNLPRFNMPLELGMFLGAKRYGNIKQKQKTCLILDREQHRYQIYISDIAGQDIRCHNCDAFSVIPVIRDWLRKQSGRKTIIGGAEIRNRYSIFIEGLPQICERLYLTVDDLIFNDYITIIEEWLKEKYD